MKTSLPLTLIGAACALLVSCGTSSREKIFVTTESGAPICGAVIVPCETQKGCNKPIYTNGCGKAKLPGNSNSYSIQKQDFRTVGGIKHTGKPQHVVMVPGWPN